MTKKQSMDEFVGFVLNLHDAVGKGNQKAFVLELFQEAGANKNHDSEVTEDMVNSWLRKSTTTYLNVFKDTEFEYIRLLTFLQGKLNDDFLWIQLQEKFIKNSDNYSFIACETDNKDVFINSLVMQFQAILKLPVIIAVEPDYIEIAGHFFNNIILAKMNLRIQPENFKEVTEKWIVTDNLSLELVFLTHYSELIYKGINAGIHYTYFIYEHRDKTLENKLIQIFHQYGGSINIVYLSQKQSRKNFFHIPTLGYMFYFMRGGEQDNVVGYEYHQFWGDTAYETYRTHHNDVVRRVLALKVIRNNIFSTSK